MRSRICLSLIVICLLTGHSIAQGPANQVGAKQGDSFKGYDFEHVVETLNTSVDPLQQEMDSSFKAFVDSVSEAERLLEEDKPREAVATTKAAIDQVLQARDKVIKPMWEGQEFLQGQIADVRMRLAEALAAGDKGAEVKLDERVEATLDGIAGRIAKEADPLRKKRLVAHYRTVRNLAEIRRIAEQMTPDQRKLWSNVLRLLDEAALKHQQVVMGTEVLFAQFEATSMNLKEYLKLMDTVDGASKLLGVVRGADGKASGMTAFAQSMQQLQRRLAGFNDAVEGSLQSSMFELEAQVEALEPTADLGQSGVAPGEIDDELASRIKRLEDKNSPHTGKDQ